MMLLKHFWKESLYLQNIINHLILIFFEKTWRCVVKHPINSESLAKLSERSV